MKYIWHIKLYIFFKKDVSELFSCFRIQSGFSPTLSLKIAQWNWQQSKAFQLSLPNKQNAGDLKSNKKSLYYIKTLSFPRISIRLVYINKTNVHTHMQYGWIFTGNDENVSRRICHTIVNKERLKRKHDNLAFSHDWNEKKFTGGETEGKRETDECR